MGSISSNDELEKAKALYHEMIESNFEDENVWYLLGTIFFNYLEYELALESINNIIAFNSHHEKAYYERANVLSELCRYEEALQDYEHSIALKYNIPESHFNQGLIYKVHRCYDKALYHYNQAITHKSDFAFAYSNRANIFQILERFDEALEDYNNAIALDDTFVDAYANRAITLHSLKRYEEALQSCDEALALNPNRSDAYCTKADTLKILNRCDEALENYEKALKLNPLFVEAYCNQGNAFKALHRYDEAMQSYNKALELNPNHANAHRNKAILCLTLGDLQQGFELYEWRWLKDDYTSFKEVYTEPLWLGEEDLVNKTILIHSEQGFGDVIHFCRYLELLSERGAKVILSVEKPLYALLKDIKGVFHCCIKGEVLPPFDYHCPLLSLPLACKTTMQNIPSNTPYLQAEAQKIAYWTKRLKTLSRPKIGIVCRGNPLHNNDHNRSISFKLLYAYLPQGFEYICLQQVMNEADKPMLEQTDNLHFYGDALHDFSDTAGLCACMDAIISVDTSVAHLAGAMHKKTILLLPYAPDWRWFDAREDSPWYPSMHLLRQQRLGDWSSCLSQLSSALYQILS